MFCVIATNNCGKLCYYFVSKRPLSENASFATNLTLVYFPQTTGNITDENRRYRELHREWMKSKKYNCVRATKNGLKVHAKTIDSILWVRTKTKAICVSAFLCCCTSICSESCVFSLFVPTDINVMFCYCCVSYRPVAFISYHIKQRFIRHFSA